MKTKTQNWNSHLPKRADKLSRERVLHVHINGSKAVDQQEGLVRALRELGSDGYEMIRWTDYDHEERQKQILEAAKRLSPTLVFMQLQAPDVVDLETIRKLREISPEVVIATWCGDIADCNSPFALDWQTPLGRIVDLTLHSSFTHVLALRAAGIHNAGYLQIGLDEQQYRKSENPHLEFHYSKPPVNECGAAIGFGSPARIFDFDVSFLGSRYGQGDPFSSTYKWKDGRPAHDSTLRDEIVAKMHEKFGERFGLFGSGWGSGVEAVPVTRSHEIYWRSKIGLSISLDNKLECYTSDRLFRILGCSAMLLVKSFPGMKTLGLTPGLNCIAFDDAKDAVELAHAFARDDAARIRIAEAGARLAREDHAWPVRMLELQPYIDAVRAARRAAR